MNEPAIIALLSESSTKKRRWRGLLSGVNCKVIAGADLTSSGLAADIVITDSQSQLDDSPSWRGQSGIFGIIAIGAELAADVVFSEQPSERELRLACDLLYEIVQLRRERAASQQTQQMLTEIAELDALTGVANRRAWDAEWARRTERDNESDESQCLMLIDLDHFKEVNTTHGYAVADQVLQQVGNVLTTSVRAGDFVARIGGDEFGVLLSNISVERAGSVVDRIRASIEASLRQAGSVVVTATAGFAVRQRSEDAESLFAEADANLRQGKAAGRNRTVAST